VADLIATDVVLPYFRRNALEELFFVDVDALGIRVVSKPLLAGLDSVVAFALETSDWRIELG